MKVEIRQSFSKDALKLPIKIQKEIAAIIQQIQQFDPPGIAARDLQECLLLQQIGRAHV